MEKFFKAYSGSTRAERKGTDGIVMGIMLVENRKMAIYL